MSWNVHQTSVPANSTSLKVDVCGHREPRVGSCFDTPHQKKVVRKLTLRNSTWQLLQQLLSPTSSRQHKYSYIFMRTHTDSTCCLLFAKQMEELELKQSLTSLKFAKKLLLTNTPSSLYLISLPRHSSHHSYHQSFSSLTKPLPINQRPLNVLLLPPTPINQTGSINTPHRYQ